MRKYWKSLCDSDLGALARLWVLPPRRKGGAKNANRRSNRRHEEL